METQRGTPDKQPTTNTLPTPRHIKISEGRVHLQTNPRFSGLGFPVLNEYSGLGCQYKKPTDTATTEFYFEPDSIPNIQSPFIRPRRPGGQP